MAIISACTAIKDKVKCKLRYECKRYSLHLSAVSKQQSYIKPQYQADGTCEMKLEI